MDNVHVEWFNQETGVGEGSTTDGRLVFLNAARIKSGTGRFRTLRPGETVRAEIGEIEPGLYNAVAIEMPPR